MSKECAQQCTLYQFANRLYQKQQTEFEDLRVNRITFQAEAALRSGAHEDHLKAIGELAIQVGPTDTGVAKLVQRYAEERHAEVMEAERQVDSRYLNAMQRAQGKVTAASVFMERADASDCQPQLPAHAAASAMSRDVPTTCLAREFVEKQLLEALRAAEQTQAELTLAESYVDCPPPYER